jgi:pyrroline-5-carboxylate reductase
MDSIRTPIAVIGGGAMGTALVLGALARGVLRADLLALAEPDPARREAWRREGAATFPAAADALGWLARAESAPGDGQVLLAIKPQSLPGLAAGLHARGGVGKCVLISILAGTPSAAVRAALGGAARVVRAIPNTPARIGRGVTGIALGAGAHAGDDALARRLFAAAGPVVETIDEALMDAFTAVVGSGPAYVFYLAEAMARAAESLGFAPDVADRIVRHTVAGAGELLAQSAETPSDLRAAVTSRGGTTAAATAVLDAAGAMDTIVRALTAARDRGRELASIAAAGHSRTP